MHIISRPVLIEFWENHPDAETPLRYWFKRVEHATWKNLNELKSDFPDIDYFGNNRAVFEIKGNKYRIILLIFFTGSKVYIQFVGTFAEYDKIDARPIFKGYTRTNRQEQMNMIKFIRNKRDYKRTIQRI